MIKTIAYFPLQAARNAAPVLETMLDCLQANGIKTQENSMNADAAIIWSVLWNGRMANNESVYYHYRNLNKPVICVDIGSLYRGTTWKVAVNNINSTGYYGHAENLDWDRPKKLGISLATLTSSNPHIILAAQHRNSLQVKPLSSIENWINHQIDLLRQYTDRPIVIRPHPRCKLHTEQLHKNLIYEEPNHLQNTYDSFDMHFNCHAVINYNSGPGIQAAISGTRPIVDQTSLAHPVSINYKDIEQPYKIERELWLIEICHTEYTLDELQRGIWLKRISPALNLV